MSHIISQLSSCSVNSLIHNDFFLAFLICYVFEKRVLKEYLIPTRKTNIKTTHSEPQ